MAESLEKEPKRAKRLRPPIFGRIESLFMLNKSEKVRGRDGKTYEIFHRSGAAGGAFTKTQLMQEEGFKAELSAVERDANKRYKSIQDARSVVDSRESKLKSVLNNRVSAFKRHLIKVYEPMGLIPLIASVRIHSETEERQLFIQGWVNGQGEFVIGNRDDAALWAIEIMKGAAGLVGAFKLAHTVGKELIQRGLSGPIKERLALTLKG